MSRSIPLSLTLAVALAAQVALGGCNKKEDVTAPSTDTAASAPDMSASSSMGAASSPMDNASAPGMAASH
jgi:hypothetical protein